MELRLDIAVRDVGNQSRWGSGSGHQERLELTLPAAFGFGNLNTKTNSKAAYMV